MTQLEAACSAIGGQMDNSINAYTGSDCDSSGGVRDAGAPVTRRRKGLSMGLDPSSRTYHYKDFNNGSICLSN